MNTTILICILTIVIISLAIIELKRIKTVKYWQKKYKEDNKLSTTQELKNDLFNNTLIYEGEKWNSLKAVIYIFAICIIINIDLHFLKMDKLKDIIYVIAFNIMLIFVYIFTIQKAKIYAEIKAIKEILEEREKKQNRKTIR